MIELLVVGAVGTAATAAWIGFELGKRHARRKVESHLIRPTFLGTWNDEGNFRASETRWTLDHTGEKYASAPGRHELYLVDEHDVIGLRGQLEVRLIHEYQKKHHFDQWDASVKGK